MCHISLLSENPPPQIWGAIGTETMASDVSHSPPAAMVQLGLHKRKLWYDFSSYVGRTELDI